MTVLLFGVLTASLLGSLHCVGMCGPFVALTVGPTVGGRAISNPWPALAAYHIGRLVTYTVFGLLAGLIGASLNLGGSLIHIQRAATVLAAATLVLFGVIILLRALGLRSVGGSTPRWLIALAQRGHKAAWTLTPLNRAVMIGLLTTLLPCGWLYAFVVTAAGTGHAINGALVMAVFWIGTLPAMIGLGAGLHRFAGPLGNKAPIVVAVLLLGIGLFTLARRSSLVGLELPAAAQSQTSPSVPDHHVTPPCCHGD